MSRPKYCHMTRYAANCLAKGENAESRPRLRGPSTSVRGERKKRAKQCVQVPGDSGCVGQHVEDTLYVLLNISSK
ncbi:hypothetical protein BV25DRAFT_1831911 [Artomyces pyxidatus]|uniref:Uncharacterized protein n=1 Tax=Artomyces pyxidatus TaxID=48021 RepID=A0ACB8SLG1_9AGAM|nr:hypothetical protein BV25DRAFT_1831911 [Artomyces pyxidatus]